VKMVKNEFLPSLENLNLRKLEPGSYLFNGLVLHR